MFSSGRTRTWWPIAPLASSGGASVTLSVPSAKPRAPPQMTSNNNDLFPSLVDVAEGVDQRHGAADGAGAAAAEAPDAECTSARAGDADTGPAEIESYCMNCEENGITRLLLTRIPFFREVVLMSFSVRRPTTPI